MTKDATITVRLPSALKAAIEDVAERDGRSASQLCVVVLMRHLESIGEWPRKPGARGAAASKVRSRPRRA